MKKYLDDHFHFLASMSIKEITLYRTWHQINYYPWVKKSINKIKKLKNELWLPKNVDDYLNIDPILIFPKNQAEHQIWRILRYFTCTAPTTQAPGRKLRVIVKDRNTNTYLGIMELISDFYSLKPRDNYIGWRGNVKKSNLRYLSMGGTIVPTQPLGFNYVGGKLMSLLLCSDKIVNEWNRRYKEPMVALTTTSLYGGFSQYTRLKYWKKIGTTEGNIRIEPSDEVNLKLRHWMRDNYPKEFKAIGYASRPKTRITFFCYKKFDVKPPENKAPRGVYFCELYDNTVPFLKGDDSKLGEKRFDNSFNNMIELWKSKYAKKRVNNLIKSDRYNTDILYYDNLIDTSWENVHDYYFGSGKKIIKNNKSLCLFFN